VHFNADVVERFFRMEPGSARRVTFEHVDELGYDRGTSVRPLVFSEVNKNLKIEFDFGGVRDYPSEGVPLLLVLELGLRAFRYQLLLPDVSGYEPMLELNRSLPKIGRGLRRVITTLDEVELRWRECPLRRPAQGDGRRA